MFNEDLKVFFEGLDAKDVIFTLKEGTVIETNSDGEPIKGLFDNSFMNPELGNTVVLSDEPILTCIYSDVAEVTRGSSVVIDEKTYKVIENNPVESGLALMRLSDK